MLARLRGSRAPGLVLIIALLAAWEVAVATKVLDFFSLPQFSRVLTGWIAFISSGDFIDVLAPSIRRLAAGFGIAVTLGVSVGLLMGASRFIYNTLEPLVEILRPMPSAAMIPILILFLGIGDEMKVAVIAFASVWPILLNTYSGVRSVDPVQIDTARTLGLSSRATLVKVVIPNASPYIFAGMRISLAIAFVLVIVSEMLTGGGGLGSFILNTQRQFQVVETYVGIITIGMLGYLLNILFLLAQRRLMGWHAQSVRAEPA